MTPALTSMPMKDSGMGWVGAIPSHWDVRPFYSFAGEVDSPNTGLKERNLLSLSYGQLVRKDMDRLEGLTPASFEGYNIIEANDIVFRLTDLQNDQRSLRSARAQERGIITSAYVTVRPQASPRFFEYLMRSYDTSKVFYGIGGGIRQSMKFADLKRLPVVVPPTSEMEAISSYLDRATARIDTLVAKKTRFIELLREEIVSLATSCQVDESTRWVRLRYVSDIQSRPVEMGAGNTFTRLGLYNRGRGIFKKDSADTEDMGDSNFQWIEDGDLILSGQFAWEGAVAMARKEHVGCVVSHRYPVVRGRADEVLSEYLYAYFLTAHGDMVLNDCSRGSAGRNRPLNMGLLMNWKVPIPPMNVQERIAKLLQKKEKAEALQKRSIALLKEHLTALITAAVTGKIDLRNAA